MFLVCSRFHGRCPATRHPDRECDRRQPHPSELTSAVLLGAPSENRRAQALCLAGILVTELPTFLRRCPVAPSNFPDFCPPSALFDEERAISVS